MKSFRLNKKALSKNMTYLLIVILVFAAVSWIYAEGVFDNPLEDEGEEPTTPSEPNETVEGTVVHSAAGRWRIRDALTKTATASGDAAYVGIIRADANGVFDPLNPMEETEFDADPDTGKVLYSTGNDLVLAVSSDNDPTNGYETYPRWFYIKDLAQSAPIRAFSLTNPISCVDQFKSGNTYKFTVNEANLGETVGNVQWMANQTPYWDFGTFELYGRPAKTHLLFQTVNKGTVGASVTNGATWIDTDGEITANFTLTSDKEDIFLQLIGEQADTAFGLPFLGLSASGKISQYEGVLIFGTDANDLDAEELYNDGWEPIIAAGLYSETAYYYSINPVTDGCIPGTGGIISASIPVTIDDAALTASTEYEFEVWVLDAQNLENVARGATTNYTTLPGINGFISDQGLDTTVLPLAMTFSSGAVATPQLMGHFTTNS
jgi:hypothetical protein